MLFRPTLIASALAALQFQTATACVPAAPVNTSVFPHTIRGPDTASDYATLGYATNHFSLNVRNLTASLNFYGRVFGMRLLFTSQFSPSFSISYIGHSAGGRNKTGYQTTDELIRYKNSDLGHIEFQFFDDPASIANLTATTDRANTFSHIGMIVPDVATALARIEALGDVKILSRPGEIPAPGSALTKALGLGNMAADHPEAQVILGVYAEVSKALLFVEDPDGNVIEIQNLVDPISF